MKKAFLILPLLLLLVFLPKSNDPPAPPPDNDMFYVSQKFNFVSVYNPDDSYFSRRIHTMIDQEYDNFEIYLLIDSSLTSIINPIVTYAKKENKAHLLHIIHKDSDLADAIALNDLYQTLNTESMVVHMKDHTLLYQKEALATLNEAYRKSSHTQFIHTSFIHIPSYKENKTKLSFDLSPLQAIKTNILQKGTQPTKDVPSLYLETPLVILSK